MARQLIGTLLTTKLRIPLFGRELVRRPRLTTRLDDALRLGHRLTLISAPAGFGKTTLLREWIQGLEGQVASPRPARVAWLSLDQGDNDLERFLAYLSAALQVACDGPGKGHRGAALSAPAPSPGPLLTALINQLQDVPERVVLILDDYHLISAPAVHEAVSFFLENPPDGMHVIIATRADPALPLARLRARGLLAELRAKDLAFTCDEAADFLKRVMGLELAAAEVAALATRTDGWIAGLQLAALSLQGCEDHAAFVRAFTGSSHHVADYLVEEVLDHQPGDIQAFLLQTAILDRLTGPLCDAVTGQQGGQDTLERLEHANLFLVPLDDERRWYRYRQVFADLLRSCLRQRQPDLVPVLHRRASEWYQENRLMGDAVLHALAAGDAGRVVDLVEGYALSMMDRGEVLGLLRWLESLPPEMARRQPGLAIIRAWSLVHLGQLETVEDLLQSVERTLDAVPETEARRAAGHIAAIRSCHARLGGDLARAAELAREALAQLPEGDWMARALAANSLGLALRPGSSAGTAGSEAEGEAAGWLADSAHCAVVCLSDLAISQMETGKLRQALDTCRHALQLADEYQRRNGRRLPAMGWVYARMSLVLHERNELDAAVQCARTGVEMSEKWGLAEALVDSYAYLAEALRTIGDIDGAHAAIRKAKRVGSGLSAWLVGIIERYEACVLLAQGDVAGAALLVQGHADYPYHVDLVLARIRLQQGRPEEALRLTEHPPGKVAGGCDARCMVRPLAVRAVALQALHRPGEALAAIEQALLAAEPEGHVRSFVDLGKPMHELLLQAAARGIAPEYVRRLLAALEAELPGAGSWPAARAGGLTERLSVREVEVLRLLAAGSTNTEIGETLVIAVGTVKNHLKSIYGKLAVHNRTQAVNRARELGLV